MVRSSKSPAGVHKSQPPAGMTGDGADRGAGGERAGDGEPGIDGPGELVVSGMAGGNEGDGDSPRMIARGAPAGEAGPHGGSLTDGLAREPPSEAIPGNGAAVMS